MAGNLQFYSSTQQINVPLCPKNSGYDIGFGIFPVLFRYLVPIPDNVSAIFFSEVVFWMVN